MNVITHEKAYSIFPRATFEERQSLIYANEETALEALLKYQERGWKFFNRVHVNEARDPLSPFSQGSRHLGDSKCWTIRLQPTYADSPSIWESNSWRLEYNDFPFPMHVWMLLKRPNQLRFTYLVDVELVNLVKAFDFDVLQTNENEW